MKLLNTIRKTKNFDVYQPWGRSGRINPFYIDHWLETFQNELPYRICIVRDFDLLNNDEWEEVIEYLSLAYRKILVCSEGITSLEPLGWSRMPKMFDSVIWINNERPVPEHYKQEFYWPAHWFRTIQFYSKTNPKVFIYENVKGLVNHDKGRTWAIVKRIFKNLGYKIFFRTLNSKDYGIPQHRDRIFVVGFRKKWGR